MYYSAFSNFFYFSVIIIIFLTLFFINMSDPVVDQDFE